MRNKLRNLKNRFMAFIRKPKIVKLATASLAVETIIGVVGTVASTLLWMSAGHPIIAGLIVMMWLMGVLVRFIVSVNAN